MKANKKTNLKAVRQNSKKKSADKAKTKPAKPGAKKPTAKKTVKPAAKKAVKPVPKKTNKPLAKNEIYVRGDGVQLKIYKKIPKGWEVNECATAAPKGYKIIDNKKSLFAKNKKDRRKYGLIETEYHKNLTKKQKDNCHGGKPITIIKRSGKKVIYGGASRSASERLRREKMLNERYS